MIWRVGRAIVGLLALCSLPGCYYGHLARGHLRLLWAREPIERLLTSSETPEALRSQLALVPPTRDFARELGLRVDRHYTSYVDWPGDRIVTTVVATRPGEVASADFWFPIVGHVPYKGFFDPQRAAAEAERLRAEGLDVCELAVPAYSTLGWTEDPVTRPMLLRGDGPLVETLLHELVHATVFWPDDADLSESAARFVGEEATLRVAADLGLDADRERARVRDSRRLAASIVAFRGRVAALYDLGLPPAERDARRAGIEADARARIAELPLETRDARQLARRLRLNDACIALRGTYAGDLPLHAALLERLDGDLVAFVAHLRAAADSTDPRARLFGAAGPAPHEPPIPPLAPVADLDSSDPD